MPSEKAEGVDQKFRWTCLALNNQSGRLSTLNNLPLFSNGPKAFEADKNTYCSVKKGCLVASKQFKAVETDSGNFIAALDYKGDEVVLQGSLFQSEVSEGQKFNMDKIERFKF